MPVFLKKVVVGLKVGYKVFEKVGELGLLDKVKIKNIPVTAIEQAVEDLVKALKAAHDDTPKA